MRTIWKWILGLLAVLLVCGLLGGLGFFFARGRGLITAAPVPGDSETWRMPMHRGGYGPGGGQDFGPYMYDHMQRAHRGYGFSPFGMGFMMFGGLFRLLIPLLLIGLVGVGGYLLGRNSARRAATYVAAPPAPEASVQSPPPPAEPVGPPGAEPEDRS